VFWINEDLDAARRPWLPSDEAGAFEREHHLVNRRRADAKVFLHVGFRRGSAMMRKPSGSFRIIYRPTPPAPCIRRSHPPKPGGFRDGASSTTPPSTQASSTWLRLRSASCGTSASIAGSTIPSDCAAKSPPGNAREMLPAHASNGCSQQTRLASKWAVPIPLLPKSHNHCAEPLVSPGDVDCILPVDRRQRVQRLGAAC
jgi:hypothetical protein